MDFYECSEALIACTENERTSQLQPIPNPIFKPTSIKIIGLLILTSVCEQCATKY